MATSSGYGSGITGRFAVAKFDAALSVSIPGRRFAAGNPERVVKCRDRAVAQRGRRS